MEGSQRSKEMVTIITHLSDGDGPEGTACPLCGSASRVRLRTAWLKAMEGVLEYVYGEGA